MSGEAAQQGVEADEAEHNGASQLNSSVRRTVARSRDRHHQAGVAQRSLFASAFLVSLDTPRGRQHHRAPTPACSCSQRVRCPGTSGQGYALPCLMLRAPRSSARPGSSLERIADRGSRWVASLSSEAMAAADAKRPPHHLPVPWGHTPAAFALPSCRQARLGEVLPGQNDLVCGTRRGRRTRS